MGLLGEGGMGEVYLAEHEVLGKDVVAKLLRIEFARDPGIVERMRLEAQALAALSHPNIVSVTDFGTTAAGRPFYVMECLNGCTVGECLRREGPPLLSDSLEIVRQVLDGLGSAHSRGLVHRDIKPENVFLHRDRAGRQVVKLLDFGIAKVLAGASGAPAPPSIPTAEGAVIGTPRYISPEQVLGRVVDHRADLYAVGLLLYALVNGKGPFEHLHSTRELFEAQLTAAPSPLTSINPTLPPALDEVVLRALQKRPEDRFRDAAEFSSALAAVSRAPSATNAAQPAPPPAADRSIGSIDTLLSPAQQDAATAGPGHTQPTAGPPVADALASDRTQPTGGLAAADDAPVHRTDQTVRDRTPPHAVPTSEPTRRDPTQPLAEQPPPVTSVASTRSARPGATRGKRDGAAQRASDLARLQPAPFGLSAYPYATGAVASALVMGALAFVVGLHSRTTLVAAIVASAVLGTGVALASARQ